MRDLYASDIDGNVLKPKYYYERAQRIHEHGMIRACCEHVERVGYPFPVGLLSGHTSRNLAQCTANWFRPF
jgi:hypothetical protein